MNKRIRLIAMFAAIMLLLCACTNTDMPQTEAYEPATTPVPAATTQPEPKQLIPSPSDYVSAEQMALADSWAGSDESAIAAVMRKAASGQRSPIIETSVEAITQPSLSITPKVRFVVSFN